MEAVYGKSWMPSASHSSFVKEATCPTSMKAVPFWNAVLLLSASCTYSSSNSLRRVSLWASAMSMRTQFKPDTECLRQHQQMDPMKVTIVTTETTIQAVQVLHMHTGPS